MGLMIINLDKDVFIAKTWKLYCLIFVSGHNPLYSDFLLKDRNLDSTSSTFYYSV